METQQRRPGWGSGCSQVVLSGGAGRLGMLGRETELELKEMADVFSEIE
jgi:hypothetical protein